MIQFFPIITPGCIITPAPIQESSPTFIGAFRIYFCVFVLFLKLEELGAEKVINVTLGAKATLSPKITLCSISGEANIVIE